MTYAIAKRYYRLGLNSANAVQARHNIQLTFYIVSGIRESLGNLVNIVIVTKLPNARIRTRTRTFLAPIRRSPSFGRTLHVWESAITAARQGSAITSDARLHYRLTRKTWLGSIFSFYRSFALHKLTPRMSFDVVGTPLDTWSIHTAYLPCLLETFSIVPP